MSEREIKVTKCGEQRGCLFDDRVSIAFSPSELTDLKYIFRKRAEATTDYAEQIDEHERCELFTEASRMWEKARKEKEESKK